MKHKLLLSGILSIMLVFGLLLFTGCPMPGEDDPDPENNTGQNGGNNGNGNDTGQNGNGTGNGNNNGQNGNDTGQNGGNTGQNGGNNNTQQEGVYIGLISFAGDATDLTDGVPVFLDAAGKNTLTSKLNSGYAISSQGGTALFYAVHKALANLKSRETQYPANLDLVRVITFTDGLDNGSTGISAANPIEEKTFDSDTDYTTYLSEQIANRRIADKPITAYSVGVRGSDVSDTAKFESDLAQIATTGNSQSLTDFGNLQSTFQGIANSLQITHSSTTFTMKTTLLASGTKVRMTFDVTSTNPPDAAASAKYIEGTITRTGTGTGMVYTFGNITYAGGLGSTQGAGPITGTINGTEVNFSFTGVSGYTPSTDESKAKQWTMPSGSNAWQVNSEYDIGGATDTQIEKRSAIIYLVLDASKSLNTTQIGQIRSAASEFINSLYNQLNNGSTPSTPNTPSTPSVPNAPGNVTAQPSGNGISVSWASVSGATSYKVYRSASSSGTYTLVGSPSSTSYTDSSVSPGTTYYYKVKAVNGAGESGYSSYTSATIPGGGGEYPDEPTVPIPSNAITLTSSQSWRTGDSLSTGFSEMWYCVSVPDSSGYYLSAKDAVYGNGYSADIVFDVYKSSDSGLTLLGTFDAGNGNTQFYPFPSSETFYIKVYAKNEDPGNYGSYAMYFW